MIQRESIVRTLQNAAKTLHERFSLKSLSVFGSAARDEAQPTSDIDVLVDFEGQPTFDQFMDLKFYLEDLLGRPVDLVTRSGLREQMRSTVEREAVRVA